MISSSQQSKQPQKRKSFATEPRPDLFSTPDEYYDIEDKILNRTRTLSISSVEPRRRRNQIEGENVSRNRRLSHDEPSKIPRRFLVNVDDTLAVVLEQEDTDRNAQISITDAGPKLFSLGTASSNGYNAFDIRGNYMLSNLLQELATAKDQGRSQILLDEARLAEDPLQRLHRMIKFTFWKNLTRTIDRKGLEKIILDPKDRSEEKNPLIYVPHDTPHIYDYYVNVAKEKPELNLRVERLPKYPDDPQFVRSISTKPGLLALEMRESATEPGQLEGIPFVVPGARFNEIYNWDSYFMALGLISDDLIDLAQGIVDHFIFQIRHYGKVLNGNRSYYLTRSQPPFLTDLALQIYRNLPEDTEKENKEWLARAIRAAIKEYHNLWMTEPRLDRETGLSRFRPPAIGIPPETEASHFLHVLEPFAEKHNMGVDEFIQKYNDQEVIDTELDEFFMHDIAIRESGHDTTTRFENCCADLATVDLNTLLYKYEVDIGFAIRDYFDDHLELFDEFDITPSPFTEEVSEKRKSTETVQHSKEWFERAKGRRHRLDHYCWNEQTGCYYDYNTAKKEQTTFESVTSLWPLWAGCATEHQAKKLVENAVPKFEVMGGLVSCTEESRGPITPENPVKQWDFPYAWPPHQVLAWVGLERYGYMEIAQRLAYKWIYLMTIAFVDFNGTVTEKFDAVKLTHMVDAEYGNQGIDFACVPREGFGWSNASFQVGLTFLTSSMKTALSVCTTPEVYFSRRQADDDETLSRETPSIPPAVLVSKGGIESLQKQPEKEKQTVDADKEIQGPLADKRKRMSIDISQAIKGLN
ncbi:trehalase-domain-containing protein [Wallemia mellicola]|nr:trehalase-domain-containing protein [Wallemia mellicola]